MSTSEYFTPFFTDEINPSKDPSIHSMGLILKFKNDKIGVFEAFIVTGSNICCIKKELANKLPHFKVKTERNMCNGNMEDLEYMVVKCEIPDYKQAPKLDIKFYIRKELPFGFTLGGPVLKMLGFRLRNRIIDDRNE